MSRGFVVLVVLLCTAACDQQPQEPTTIPREGNKVTTLIITKKDDGPTRRVGTITFADGSAPDLNVEAGGQDAADLQQAWTETRAIEKLPMSDNKPVERNGKSVMQFGEVLVPKTDPDYKWAVYDYFERKFGYQVDVQQ